MVLFAHQQTNESSVIEWTNRWYYVYQSVTRSIRACNKYVYVCKRRPGWKACENISPQMGQIPTSVMLAVVIDSQTLRVLSPIQNNLINKVNILNLWVVLLPRAKLRFVFCFFLHFTFVLALLLSLHTCFCGFKISNKQDGIWSCKESEWSSTEYRKTLPLRHLVSRASSCYIFNFQYYYNVA